MPDPIHRGDRSIRSISVPEQRRAPIYQEEYNDAPRPRRPGRRVFWFITAAVVLVCVLAGLLLSTVFEHASVTVYPRTATVTPPPTLQAFLKPGAGQLAYQTLSVSISATTTVAAAGTAHVSRQASGIITIYNSYDAASQRLIANTRFAAPDGKIYRIHDSIVVPGASKNADGSLAAGTATISVFADSPGDSYNRTDNTTFTLPGFKGTPRYNKFYAQSQGPITGGFVGDEPAIALTDLAKAQDDLKSGLDLSAHTAVTNATPDGFVLVDGSVVVHYDNLLKTPAAGGAAALSQHANATADVIRLFDLASALAKQVDGYKGEAVGFVDPSLISVSLSPDKNKQTPTGISLALSGSPMLVWRFDAPALKAALIGKQKSDFESIIKKLQPAITKAEASFRPFWINSFPNDPDKISFDISIGQ